MKKGLIRRPETAVEVFKLLPEGVFCQVIDNVIYMSPAPTFNHQDTVAEILLQLRLFTNKRKAGKCVTSPVDVFLNEYNAFQPDIIFIATKNLSNINEDGNVYGAPDIVVEVLSPRNEEHDKIKKREVYEASGVKEYFIVEPRSKEVIALYLTKGKFEEAPKSKSKIVSKLLKKTFKF